MSSVAAPPATGQLRLASAGPPLTRGDELDAKEHRVREDGREGRLDDCHGDGARGRREPEVDPAGRDEGEVRGQWVVAADRSRSFCNSRGAVVRRLHRERPRLCRSPRDCAEHLELPVAEADGEGQAHGGAHERPRDRRPHVGRRREQRGADERARRRALDDGAVAAAVGQERGQDGLRQGGRSTRGERAPW